MVCQDEDRKNNQGPSNLVQKDRPPDHDSSLGQSSEKRGLIAFLFVGIQN
jgi:hypothetical protein